MAALIPRVLVFTLVGPVDRVDLAGLCARVDGLLEHCGADVLVCDVGTAEPDAVTVEALGRLQLAARRAGCRLRLRSASRELRDLVALIGLDDVLPAEEDVTPEASAGGRTAGRASPWRGRT
jgi:ABC-type transporter Mla MlaB component